MKIGCFGSSTGAGAALLAAAALGKRVSAVVSRGGRPDLAGGALRQVICPTLLIVGGLDEVVIRLNQEAFAKMGGEKELRIIPGALIDEAAAAEILELHHRETAYRGHTDAEVKWLLAQANFRKSAAEID